MCGLAAIYAYRDSQVAMDRLELQRMQQAMLARGPDGAGLWVSPDETLGLAHRRLAIIDLSSAAAQPMATLDGRLRIVFNGEIYNYRELRDRLQARGHRFHSHSDTEVLLHGYREYGEDLVRQLRGMFAFAIWDCERRGLFLARDHFGIKPLYYHDDGRAFRVASQVKAILAGGGIDTRVEPAGHVGFFLWGSVPDPYTLYRDLFALPAGHTLWVDEQGPRSPRRYFDIATELSEAGEPRQPETAPEALRAALRDSVKHHLIADVPVGVFLSSGLDSATIAALASEHQARASGMAQLSGGETAAGETAVRAITLGFAEYENTLFDEVPLAREIASRYRCAHHVSRIERTDFEEDLPALLAAMDQPSIDGVNTWFVARETARSGLRVALSGLGGDELLGGYPSFRQIPAMVSRIRPCAAWPGFGRAFRLVATPLLRHWTSPKFAGLIEYGGSFGGAYLLRKGLFMPWELPRFLDGELVREGWNKLQPVVCMNEWSSRIGSPHAKVAALEMAFFMRDMLLRDSDWASMAHSLEIRVPLVDVALFRAMAPHLAGKAPPAKRDLALVPDQVLPDHWVSRPKTGFFVPVREWLESRGEAGGQRGLRGWALRIDDLSGLGIGAA
jgi:asparagine synthase (glutamine-hydrolysing)